MLHIRDKDNPTASNPHNLRKSSLQKRKRRLDYLLKEDIRQYQNNYKIGHNSGGGDSHHVPAAITSVGQSDDSPYFSSPLPTFLPEHLAENMTEGAERRRSERNNKETKDLNRHDISEIHRLMEDPEEDPLTIAAALGLDEYQVRTVIRAKNERDYAAMDPREPEAKTENQKENLAAVAQKVLEQADTLESPTVKKPTLEKPKKNQRKDRSSLASRRNTSGKTVPEVKQTCVKRSTRRSSGSRDPLVEDVAAPEVEKKSKTPAKGAKRSASKAEITPHVDKKKKARVKSPKDTKTTPEKSTPKDGKSSEGNEEPDEDANPGDESEGTISIPEIPNDIPVILDMQNTNVAQDPIKTPEKRYFTPNPSTDRATLSRLYFAQNPGRLLSREEMSRWIDPNLLSRFNPAMRRFHRR